MLGLRERCKNMQTFLIWETNCHKEHERKISIKNIKAQHCPSKGNTGGWKCSFACEYGQCFLTLRKTQSLAFFNHNNLLWLWRVSWLFSEAVVPWGLSSPLQQASSLQAEVEVKAWVHQLQCQHLGTVLGGHPSSRSTPCLWPQASLRIFSVSNSQFLLTVMSLSLSWSKENF